MGLLKIWFDFWYHERFTGAQKKTQGKTKLTNIFEFKIILFILTKFCIVKPRFKADDESHILILVLIPGRRSSPTLPRQSSQQSRGWTPASIFQDWERDHKIIVGKEAAHEWTLTLGRGMLLAPLLVTRTASVVSEASLLWEQGWPCWKCKYSDTSNVACNRHLWLKKKQFFGHLCYVDVKVGRGWENCEKMGNLVCSFSYCFSYMLDTSWKNEWLHNLLWKHRK